MPSCTMQQRSSITITPAEPAAVPTAASESTSKPTSIWSAVRIGVDEPPGITAFSARPSGIPPARS